MIEKLVKLLFSPVTFALAFLAPLFAQILDALALSLPIASNLTLAFIVAGTWGLVAQLRGSWIWLK
jgi:hypothetical protein